MQIYFLLPSLIIFTKGANNSDQYCIYILYYSNVNYRGSVLDNNVTISVFTITRV